jgi:UDP-N-acetylmuramyl tripeptide synthase
MHRISIVLGKTVGKISNKLNRAGSTWPGHIALKINSNFIHSVLKNNPQMKVVLVAGTNGKTTTTKLIQEILENEGHKVFRNEAGANLLNGIASSIVLNSDITGKLPFDIALFEVDENSLPLVLDQIKPFGIILLNLFRDQLDRYGEVNSIAKKWQLALGKVSKQTLLVTNGDDPMLSFIGEKSGLNSFYFGLAEKYMKVGVAPHDVDFLYCPQCKTKLTYKMRSYSHMGIFECPSCKFTHDKTETFSDLPNPMLGNYNKYNINAAALLLTKGFQVEKSAIENVLKKFSPAFGRQEEMEYKGKNIFLLLSKNPTGFNQSIQGILEKDKNPNVLLLLNDKIPDGRDVSWIWDVEFEELKNAKQITISGDRAYDMGIRMKYADISKFEVSENLNESLDNAASVMKSGETLFILATYSAMLEVRNILKGRKIL